MKKFLSRLKVDGEISRDRLSAVIVDALLIAAAVVLFISYGVRIHTDPIDTGREVTAQSAGAFRELTLPANTQAAGVDVSGLTVSEAKEKIAASVDEVLARPIELVVAGGNVVPVSLKDLSAAWVNPEVVDDTAAALEGSNPIESYKNRKDAEQSGLTLALVVTADKAVIMDYLEKNCTQYDSLMTASRIENVNGRQKLILGTPGQQLDLAGASSMLQNMGFALVLQGETRLSLPIEELYPPSIPEGYEDMEGIEELLAEAEAEAQAQAAEQP